MLPTFILVELKTPIYEAHVKIITFLPSGRYGTLMFPLSQVNSYKVVEPVVRTLKLYNLPLDYEKQFSSKIKGWLIDYRVNKLKQRLERLTPKERELWFYNRAVRNLQNNVRAGAGRIFGTDAFEIVVRDYSPVGATILANAVSRSFIIADLEFKLKELLGKYGEKHHFTTQLKHHIEELKKYLHGKPISEIEIFNISQYKIVEQAKISKIETIDKRSTLFLVFLGSIFLGGLLAFLIEILSQTFRSPRDVDISLKLPFLGSIPKFKRKYKNKLLIEGANPPSFYARCYQNLSDHLELMRRDKNLRSILVTDMEGSDDTAYLIANIGILLARKGVSYKVLIIDSNLRNPLVSKLLNISNDKGLADILEGRFSFEEALYNWSSNLTVLTAGQTVFNPSTILNSPKMLEVIEKAKEKFDVILLACADLKNFTDSIILSSITDAMIIVINEGKVKRQVAKKILALLIEAKANVLGVILNNRRFPIPEVIYKRL
jgi:capsular exopolysaccharide synthesis family protein